MLKYGSIVLAALLVFIGSQMLYTVKEYETAIKFRLGQIIDSDIQPGLRVKAPFINNIRQFDRRILPMDMVTEQLNTVEQEYLDVDYFVNWRIADVGAYYISTRGDELLAKNRISQVIRDRLRDEFAQRTLTQVVALDRGELMDKLTQSVNERAGDLGINIVDLRIKRIELNNEVLESVFTRMQTERKELANERRSLGREEAERIRSEADRQARVILAEADRDAEKLRGEGDALATTLYADAFNQDREFYRFNRSLNAYRNAFSSGQDMLVVDPSSEFFDYFGDQSPRTNGTARQ
ncbi:MAG: protease modulator HflC [Gammaproteobacteria bacterium]|jgi:membrane protease subunit HflC|nr:protease modulator HflC [Gammaproteobacteria bacterium]